MVDNLMVRELFLSSLLLVLVSRAFGRDIGGYYQGAWWEPQQCYSCHATIHAYSLEQNLTYNLQSYKDTPMAFTPGDRSCLSASTESLNKFKNLSDSSCSNRTLCGVEISEIHKDGEIYNAITRKCVGWLGSDPEERKQDCSNRYMPADGVFVMNCICETHYCNGWTFESMRERFYTQFTRLIMTNALVAGDYYPEYTGPTQAQYVPNTAEYQPRIHCYLCKTQLDNVSLAAFRNAPDVECAAVAGLKRVLDDKYAAKDHCEDYEICTADITLATDGHFEFERRCQQVDETQFRMGCTGIFGAPNQAGWERLTCACNSSYCNDWTFQSMRRTFDAHKAPTPVAGLWSERYMPHPAGQPDSNTPTTALIPRTRPTETTTTTPPTRRTRPAQPGKVTYDIQYCYECSVVVDGTGKLVTNASTKYAYGDKAVEFPVGNKTCFSESKQSLTKFERSEVCPGDWVCGVEFIEERVNSSKEGVNHKLTRKCVDKKEQSGFRNLCNNRKQIGATLVSMHCICEGANYCNDWTLNSIKQRFYTEVTTLDQANALNPGDSYPQYTGPTEGVPADKQKPAAFRCYKCQTEVDQDGRKWSGAINRDCVSESKSTLEKYAQYKACDYYDDVCIVNIRLRTFTDHNESYMVTRTCDSADFYSLENGCTKTKPHSNTGENEMTCACWANYCNDFTFSSLKDAFQQNGRALWTSGQSPPILTYTPKPGVQDPEENASAFVTRPYVLSDVGPRPNTICPASGTSALQYSSSYSIWATLVLLCYRLRLGYKVQTALDFLSRRIVF